MRIGGVDVDVCEDCGGLWLDRLELDLFADAASVMGDALTAHLRQLTTSLVDHSVRPRCPRHPDVVMMRRPYSATVPVEVDECPECGGTWLDAAELTAIRRQRR
jgi:Zn-finger nucleic acid-binding protein